MTYVLDASAVLRYLDGEEGSVRVADILKDHIAGRHKAVISSVQWGEIAGMISKVHGRDAVNRVLARLLAFGMEIVPVTPERAVRAALIKTARNIPYADAFAVELAGDSSEHILVTSDFDLKAATRDVKIEFLPRK